MTIENFRVIIYIEDKTRTAEMQEVIIMRFYVVCWMERGEVKSKIYKNLKCAEKFGRKKMVECDTSVDISKYIDNICVETFNYN